MSVESTTQNVNQSWFSTIQNKISSLCSTDCKIHTLLITGRVLQAAALVSIAGSIAFTFFVGPIALAALIPSIVSFLLGTYCADSSQELARMPIVERPYIPGQPIGLPNGGNNCWLNSGLQMLSHVPAFKNRMEQIPIFAQFLNNYKAAENKSQKIASTINSHQIREYLSQETAGVISKDPIQEDAAQLFEFLFRTPNSLYTFDHYLDHVASTPRCEPMIQLDVPRVGIPSFDQLFRSFFDHNTDRGQRQQLTFPSAPNDLLIQLKRFYREENGTEGKINDAIDVRETFTLEDRLVRAGSGAVYTCDSFIIHQGLSPAGGHYVAYIKTGDTWWYCSDTNVLEVSTKDALNAMKQSYLLHYKKA